MQPLLLNHSSRNGYHFLCVLLVASLKVAVVNTRPLELHPNHTYNGVHRSCGQRMELLHVPIAVGQRVKWSDDSGPAMYQEYWDSSHEREVATKRSWWPPHRYKPKWGSQSPSQQHWPDIQKSATFQTAPWGHYLHLLTDKPAGPRRKTICGEFAGRPLC